MLAAFLLSCIVGLSQWRADRLFTNCDGTPAADIAEYALERMVVTPFSQSCEVCCDDSCETSCGSTCYDYSFGPWQELERQPEPGAGADVCFAWDASPAGEFEGTHAPLLDEVWILRTRAFDCAGNVSPRDCP